VPQQERQMKKKERGKEKERMDINWSRKAQHSVLFWVQDIKYK
jgi:hypothetical protein